MATKKKEDKFTKKELTNSYKFTDFKDILNTILDDKKEYSILEVEKEISTFLKGKVK